MKTRQGFVSNSSSSSFVIIATDDMIKKARSKLTDFGNAVVDNICKFETATVLGIKAKVATGITSSEEFAYDAVCEESRKRDQNADEDDEVGNIRDEIYEEANDQWMKFQAEVKKLEGFVDH